MARVLKFPVDRKGPLRPRAAADGVVVFFTGVRYERLGDTGVALKKPPPRASRRARILRSH
ncbi:MAG: hypothetical protein WAT70_11840 [Rhizobiaceae bacterium]